MIFLIKGYMCSSTEFQHQIPTFEMQDPWGKASSLKEGYWLICEYKQDNRFS